MQASCHKFRFLLTCIVLLIPLGTSCHQPSPKAADEALRLNITTEPPSLDPRQATDSTSACVLLMLFEGLTRIGDDHQPHPAVAKEIHLSEDSCCYTFTLRDCRWSNGDLVTASDFLYTWQSLLDPQFPAPFAYKLYPIKNAAAIKEGQLPMSHLGVTAVDAKTLQVQLAFPTPYFLELTAAMPYYPIHPSSAQKNPNWASEASLDYVNNGPFCLTSWRHESEILLEKNPSYWDQASVHLSSLHLSMIDELTTEFYMFEMGELDWAGSPLSNLPQECIPALKKEALKHSIHEVYAQFYPATAIYYYEINTMAEPLNNIHLRRALGYAINRQQIVDHITQADQTPATALVPSMPGWNALELFQDNDEKRAQEEFSKALEELQLDGDTLPQLTLCYNTNREHQKIAQVIQQQWKNVLGITVELAHYDWKVYLDKLRNQQYQIGRMSWVGDFHDPLSFLEPFTCCRGSACDTGWQHPRYVALLSQAKQTANCKQRRTLLQQAEELLISEMPIIPIYYVTHGYLKNPQLEGVYVSPLGIVDFKNAYWHQNNQRHP